MCVCVCVGGGGGGGGNGRREGAYVNECMGVHIYRHRVKNIVTIATWQFTMQSIVWLCRTQILV